MSYIEEDDIDDEIVVERVVLDEGRERRAAQEAISQALMAATPTLENRGVKHRMLPGLWYAAINVLLVTLEADEIVALLTDRIRIVQGSAENAEAAPRTFGETAMREYIEEVVLAGEAIMESLDEALARLEEENIEDRFPETVFDTALRVLVPSWGPDHVRRAIREQASQFFQGLFEPVNFMEPSRILDPAAAKRRAVAAAATKESQPATRQEPVPDATAPFEFQAREYRDRRVRIFVGSDVVEGGVGIWAYALTITDDNGRYEFRKAGGRIKDPTGSRVAVAALHEACLAVAALKGRSAVAVETTDTLLLEAIAGRETAAARRPEDAQAWSEIDHVTAVHDTNPRLVPPALSDLLQESCDHLIRDLSRTERAAR